MCVLGAISQRAFVVHFSCVCRAFVVHFSCVCRAFVVHFSCVCRALVVHFSCICRAFVVHLSCICRAFVVHLSCICCAFVYSKLLCTLSLYDHDSGSNCMTVFTGITWYISHVDIHFDTAMTAVDMSCMNSFIVDVCFVVLYRLLYRLCRSTHRVISAA